MFVFWNVFMIGKLVIVINLWMVVVIFCVEVCIFKSKIGNFVCLICLVKVVIVFVDVWFSFGVDKGLIVLFVIGLFVIFCGIDKNVVFFFVVLVIW